MWGNPVVDDWNGDRSARQATGQGRSAFHTFEAMEKRRLSFWQMYNMSFGFLGIQFGWGLQLANMSAVYEKLGARPDAVPMLWLAAPMTGLLIQPIVGALGTTSPLLPHRRDPLFHRVVPHADIDHALDGRVAPLDSGCIDQHLDGAVPRVRRGQAGHHAAHHRL